MISIPIWKKWWSYVTEVHLESHSSPVNPALHLLLVKGRLQLCTDNSIYSFEDKYDNYYKAFERINTLGWTYEKVLILGFGLGSIPKMLEDNFKLALQYTAIEIDDVIVDLVSDYVLPHLHSPIELINADAQSFINVNKDKFDLICVDLFLDDNIPEPFKSSSFLKKLKNAIYPDGLVLYNMLGDYQSDQEKAKNFYQQQFQKLFPDASLLHTGTNFILASQRI